MKKAMTARELRDALAPLPHDAPVEILIEGGGDLAAGDEYRVLGVVYLKALFLTDEPGAVQIRLGRDT